MTFKKSVKIEVPEDWSNDAKGKFFEELISRLLVRARYKVSSRVNVSGMEIDVIAEHIDSKEKAYAECKFEKAPLQADIITKAIGNAVVREIPLVYIFSTSPPGKAAKGILEDYSTGNRTPKLSYNGPDALFNWIREGENLEFPNIPENFTVDLLTLLISPNFYTWVAEESNESGIPTHVIIFPIKGKGKADQCSLEKLWPGLDITFYENISGQQNKISTSSYEEEEIVSSVSIADSFEDYRPCRPKDFVGRKSIQKQVVDFLESIRNNDSSTRILCFRGLSGHGKSSTLIKLSYEFTRNKFKDKYFLYSIDIRSARSSQFVAKAVHASLNKALESKFLDIQSLQISVGNSGLLLSSESIQTIIKELEVSGKIIVIFFDQFEELFTKESLSNVFNALNYLALEVDALQSNLVLGFSWRTGLNPPEDHEAFHFWHSLRDKRYEISIEPFTSQEAPQLLNKLSKHLGQDLNERLKKRMLEHGQGLPWLLKKLSIHISQQLKGGSSQFELISKQFNISSLFDDDLSGLGKKEQICLRYIAINSPAEIIDVIDKFNDIPDKLVENRLVTRVGQNYTLYWDIFRDYLIEGKIPLVYWRYIPRTQLSTVIKSVKLLQERAMEVEDLSKSIGFSEKSISNLILDLQNFFLAKRDQKTIKLQTNLLQAKDLEIADHLAKQLREHIIFQKLREFAGTGKLIPPTEFREKLRQIYSDDNFKSEATLRTYSTRILQWLIFAGLFERQGRNIIVPLEEGGQKGIWIVNDAEKARIISGEEQLSLF